jgi:hypothetical protein
MGKKTKSRYCPFKKIKNSIIHELLSLRLCDQNTGYGFFFKAIVQPKKRRVKRGLNGLASTWCTIAAVLYVHLKGFSPVLSVLKIGYII